MFSTMREVAHSCGSMAEALRDVNDQLFLIWITQFLQVGTILLLLVICWQGKAKK